MAAMFPTERSGIPMFPNPVNAAMRNTGTSQPAPQPAQTSAAPEPSYEELVAKPQRELAQKESEFSEFQGLQAADQSEREARQLQRQQEALGAYRTTIDAPELKAERAEVEEKLSKPFVPTQDNFKDLATMYGLIGVLGFAIGSGGKNNAIASMSAMNGMMEGYREGRMDLYEKERKSFEDNTKALQTKISSLNNKIKEIADLAKVDYEKANLEADMLFAQEGADFLKQYKDKVGLVGTIKMLQEKAKSSEKLFEFLQKEKDRVQEKERDRSFRLQMFEMQEKSKIQLAQFNANIRKEIASMKKAGGGDGGGGRPSAINERYANTVLRSGNEVLRSLELIEQIGFKRGGGMFAGVVGKGNIPSNLQAQLGQAFTEEQEKNYNTAMSGVALELAYVLNGGYKPDVETTRKIENLLAVGPNDTVGTAAYKFTDTVAKLKAAIEVTPAYTSQQKEVRENLLNKIEKYATPEAVYQRQYGVAPVPERAVRTAPGGKTIVRQGKVTEGANKGKTIIEYSDGTREYK